MCQLTDIVQCAIIKPWQGTKGDDEHLIPCQERKKSLGRRNIPGTKTPPVRGLVARRW